MPYIPEDQALKNTQVKMTVEVNYDGKEAAVELILLAKECNGRSVAEVGAHLQRNSYEAFQVALQEVLK